MKTTSSWGHQKSVQHHHQLRQHSAGNRQHRRPHRERTFVIQRYAHLSAETLLDAANCTSDIIRGGDARAGVVGDPGWAAGGARMPLSAPLGNRLGTVTS